jgi:hypothetical protein
MDGGILTLPLRVSFGGARVLLRTAASATGCAAKLGGKATVAATRTAARVSDTVLGGRAQPMFEPVPGADVPEPAAPAVPDLREAPPISEPSTNGDLTEPPPRTQAPRVPDIAQAPRVPDIAPAPEPERPSPVTPDHVSEEPELVAELAETGAEDGAGASVTVDEPWEGYSRLTAKQVIDRLAAATPAELATVQLYESLHRNRQTVRAAAERSLKTKTGRGSPD